MKQNVFDLWPRRKPFHLGWMKEVVLGLFTTRMSAVAFHLDYVVFPPIILASLWRSGQLAGAATALALLPLGFAAWTLAEYLLHRFALHHWPYFSAHHMAHHREPRALIASPSLFTLAFFTAAVLVPLWAALGEAWALGLFAGFCLGYVAFGVVHEAVHHSDWQNPLMRYFKRLHALHHHGAEDRNFGVLTHFWDLVFGTYASRPPRRRRA